LAKILIDNNIYWILHFNNTHNYYSELVKYIFDKNIVDNINIQSFKFIFYSKALVIDISYIKIIYNKLHDDNTILFLNNEILDNELLLKILLYIIKEKIINYKDITNKIINVNSLITDIDKK
jgi:hypothetical protein